MFINDVRHGFESETGTKVRLLPEHTIASKGCAKGMLHAARGKPDRDVGLVCCELGAGYIKRFGLSVYPVAREPLAIIVNKANPISSLTTPQVRDIFSGKIKYWSEVGGRHERIVVVTRLHCKEHSANWRSVMPEHGKFALKRLDVSSEPDMAKTVSDFKHAIGHLETTSLAGAGAGLKAVRIDGGLPTSENMNAGVYPFYSTLSVVTKGDAGGEAARFVEYLRSSPNVSGALNKYGMSRTR